MGDLPRCATCYYWRMNTLLKEHTCRNPAVQFGTRDGVAVQDGAAIRTYGDSGGILAPGPKFGCVNHKPKDTAHA